MIFVGNKKYLIYQNLYFVWAEIHAYFLVKATASVLLFSKEPGDVGKIQLVVNGMDEAFDVLLNASGLVLY